MGATLAGCRAPLPRHHPSKLAKAATQTVDLELWGSFPAGVVSAFEGTHPSIHLVQSSTPYRLWNLVGAGDPGTFADLTAALRELNFDAGVLIPGSLAAWTNRGRIIGVPVAEVPWGVAWRRDAFAAAALPTPTSAWTFDDFRTACTRLQALVRSGRVKGLRAALAPIALAPPGKKPGAPGMFQGPPGWVFSPALAMGEGLWQAFIWGFGASIVRAGRFVLTAPATVAALANLVDLAREYCVPAQAISSLPTNTKSTAWFAEIQSLFAMEFVLYHRGKRPGPWAWARLPRFPVDPVIPTLSNAVAVSASKPFGAPPAPEAPETLAGARFGVWLDSPAALDATASGGMAPAVAAAAIQGRFWTGAGPGPAAVLGDWRHFRGAYDGFPTVSSTDGVVGNFAARALSDAIAGTSSLAMALADAEQRMNAVLRQ